MAKLLMEHKDLEEHLKYIVPQVKLMLIKEPGQPYSICGPLDLEPLLKPLKHYADEHLVSFHLNKNNQVTGYHIAAQGSVSETAIQPREIFKAALLCNSIGIILAHNHPSGSFIPSDEDIFATQELIKAGNLLGVFVLDHVIVSSEGIYSIRANNNDLWANNLQDRTQRSEGIGNGF